ncbi:MAG: chorismate lyase [Legionellaceae bacterium]|nr:chorismate lyase [Legionellaceae bacterium]
MTWLTRQGSITDKLKAVAKETRLEVLTHLWEMTDDWDQTALSLPENTEVLHREIMMWDDNAPCWYARTILPYRAYHAEKKLFDCLKHQALGELIHPHPDITRHDIKLYAMHSHMQEYNYLMQHLKEATPAYCLWGRVSTFTIHKQFDFYLLEIMLPGILRYCT